MILDKLTQLAEHATGRYALVTEAWRSLFKTALDASDFGSQACFDRLSTQAFNMAQNFLEDEYEDIADAVEDIAYEAHQTTLDDLRSVTRDDLTDAALGHLEAIERYLYDELVAQMHRDIALLRQTYQRVVLEVSLASRSRRIPQRTALIEYRIGNQAELDFTFHDRQSRQWSSKKYVRALWRHTLLAVYNEQVMATIADHGIDRAKVYHVDGKAEVDGLVIAFGSNVDLPTYSEIRNDVFHPNANAYLVPEARNVSS